MAEVRILVADDEAITRDNVSYILKKEGYAVSAAASGSEAVKLLAREDFDLVLTDLRMPDLDGLQVLAEAKRLRPEAEVIVLTGFATVATAVQAMQQGAYSYLAKPYKIEELRVLVAKALEKRMLSGEVRELRRKVVQTSGVSRFIGQNPKILALKDTIVQVAQLDCNVLILGETGTGKELVARIIHELSPRAGKRFMAVNCGAFTEELMTSELFGYERGAFTGAAKAKAGLIEAAGGGTVLFDEIGELPQSMQVKLLRVLQEKSFMRVGGTTEIPADIRILAATNKNLKKESEQGFFRQDLYYRLNVIALFVPPLRERKDDIPLLANHFLAKHALPGCRIKTVEPRAMELLSRYEYPGNVRELENIVERAMALNPTASLRPDDLPADLREASLSAAREEPGDWPSLAEKERRYILDVMEEAGGNKTRAAEILGIDRVSLWRKLKRYGLEE
jgi:DNA-binding NtrC family response regulator